MNKKMQCLNSLKTKLTQMKKELEESHKNRSLSRGSSAHPGKKSFNHTINLVGFSSVPVDSNFPKSPTWKNPNFWGTNPIAGKENQAITPSKWVEKVFPFRQAEKSGKIQKSGSKKLIDKKYQDNHEPLQRANKPKRQHILQNINLPQRFQFSFHGSQEKDTPRFEKIKTYSSKDTNPILYPSNQQIKGKKIIQKPNLSPNTNLISNPKSNPLLYYNNNRVSILSPKSNNRRNLSPYLAEALSSSVDQKKGIPISRSCKKHFTKYFKDNFQSMPNL